MTTRNRLLLSASLLACLVCVAMLALVRLPSGGLNKANFDRVENGLNLKEVEAVFGMPCLCTSDYLTAKVYTATWRNMDDADDMVIVHFVDGKVVHKECWFGPTENFFAKIRR
jgi:hypothetical protein